MSEQTTALLQPLLERLDRAGRRILVADLLRGALLFLAGLALVWTLGAALEDRFWLDRAPRAVLLTGILLTVVGLTILFLGLPILRLMGIYRPVTRRDVAARIGECRPDVRDRVVGLVDLVENRTADASPTLLDAAVRRLGTEVAPVSFAVVEDFKGVRRAGTAALIPLLLLITFLLAAPAAFFDASTRLLSPRTAWQRPGPFRIVVSPADTHLAQGDDLDVGIRIVGREIPETVTLSFRRANEKQAETVELNADSTGYFHHHIPDVRASFDYRVEANPVESPWYRVTTLARPLVEGFVVRLHYPAYTGLETLEQAPNVGDISAIRGTRAEVRATRSGPSLKDARIVFDDGTSVPLQTSGFHHAGFFPVQKTGTWSIRLTSETGIQNQDPIAYRITALDDAPPSVTLVDPASDAELSDTRAITLTTRITDDYGFASLLLYYRRISTDQDVEGTFQTTRVPITDARDLYQEIPFGWDLGTTGTMLQAGDKVEYYLEVRDNDAVTGPKAARTPMHRLRLPTLTEHFEALAEDRDNTAEMLDSLVTDASEIRNDFQELQEQLRRNPDARWDDRRELEHLQQKQAQLETRVEELSARMEQMARRMEENDLVRPETMEAWQQLQRVVEEMRSPELMEALRELQEAIQSLDLQQMQQSMSQFQYNEEQYRQRLERTLNLFRRMKLQQGLDETSRRAEDLARKEAELSRKTREASEQSRQESPEATQKKADELSEDQIQAGKDYEALRKRLDELLQESRTVKRGPQEQLQQLNEKLDQQKLNEMMRQNAEQLKQGKFEPSAKQQEQIGRPLQEASKQLQEMKEQMEQSGRQINKTALRRILENVLTLSRDQEALRLDLHQSASDAPALKPFTRRQMDLTESFSRVSDSLRVLSGQMPQVNRSIQYESAEALREMNEATRQMAEGLSDQAAANQKGAMMRLNELALLLSNLLDAMNNQSGGEGGMSMEQMLQQMQQMSAGQQQLNDQIQQMLNDQAGQRLTADQQQRMSQLSAAQEEIRKQLKQLLRDPTARNRLLGDMDRVGEQMEETERDLLNSRTDRRMVERQRQILTRMLEAQRSLQQRGEEDRREARTGNVPQDISPAALNPEQRAERLRRDLVDALEKGYATDYQRLIKRYFELLQQQPAARP